MQRMTPPASSSGPPPKSQSSLVNLRCAPTACQEPRPPQKRDFEDNRCLAGITPSQSRRGMIPLHPSQPVALSNVQFKSTSFKKMERLTPWHRPKEPSGSSNKNLHTNLHSTKFTITKKWNNLNSHQLGSAEAKHGKSTLRNVIQPPEGKKVHVRTWMNLGNTRLSERSQTQKDKCTVSPSKGNVQRGQMHKDREKGDEWLLGIRRGSNEE